MKQFLLTTTLLIGAVPAMAMQEPKPTATSDPHMCYVTYKADQVLKLVAPVGHEITLQLSPKDHIQKVTVSDSEHLKNAVQPADNGFIVSFKAKDPMLPQPIYVITMHEDTPRPYTIEWAAVSDQPSPPDQPSTSDKVALAAAGEQLPLPQPKTQTVQANPNYCYTVTYLYPDDEKAAKQAAWKEAGQKWQARKIEVDLHKDHIIRPLNTSYDGQGDAELAPTRIFDDYGETQIEYAGNRQMPILLTVTPDGKEVEITGITTLPNNILQLHGVYSIIRARSSEMLLCMFNKGYDPNRRGPDTGTSSPSITLEPRVGK